MDQQHVRIEEWMKSSGLSNEREEVALILAIADVCDNAIENGKLSEGQIRFLVDGASNTHALVRGNIVELILILQRNCVDVSPVLMELSESKKSNARYTAICCLAGRTTPRAITDKMLKAGLTDKSFKVRMKTAQIATVYYRKRWLAPLIAPYAEKYWGIANFQKLIHDGYVLNKHENGTYNLAVLPNWAAGPRIRSFCEAELNAKGINNLVSEMQQDKSYSGAKQDLTPIQIEEQQIVDA